LILFSNLEDPAELRQIPARQIMKLQIKEGRPGLSGALEVYFSVGMGHFGFVFVWDLFSHGEWLSGIFTGRLRFLFPLLAQKLVTMASIISPATKPSTAPRRVAQNQPQPKVIPVSFISVPLF
jgi:hypothetical protein